MRRAWIIGAALAGVVGCKEPAPTDASPSASASRDAAAPGPKPEPKAATPKDPPKPETPALPGGELIEPIDGAVPGDERIVVELPPSPGFDTTEIPDQYDDGSYSIVGLRRDVDAATRDGDSGKEVVVKAWVAKIYVPPMCPEGEVCPPQKQPHLWVTDTEDERGLKRAMLVVNYAFRIPEWEAKDWAGQPEVVMEVGKRYALRGRFKTFSDTGFSHDAGLLEFVAVRSLDEAGNEQGDWIYPPGAAWHPLSIARQEEMERALRARVGAK